MAEDYIITDQMRENLKGLQRRSAQRGLSVRISEDGRFLVWKSLKEGSTREVVTSTKLLKL